MGAIYGNHMEKTTLYLDGDDYRKLKRIAASRKQAPGDARARGGGRICRPARRRAAAEEHRRGRQRARSDLSERAEELLAGMGEHHAAAQTAVIVADTGASGALRQRRRHHRRCARIYAAEPEAWLLPWAILPEVDYLVFTRLGSARHRLWLADLAAAPSSSTGAETTTFRRAAR